jgi:branched-chain amino acid transport system substrate-binding protein
VTVSGHVLNIYASQPPGTATTAATDTLDAERLALQQAGGKVGTYTIKLVALHGRLLSDNARTAVQDQKTIAYLGELVPGTSQVSVQILNQQGVLEVSPADTGTYLTQAVPTVASSPTTFYPGHNTYKATFGRVVPTTTQEARATVEQMQAVHASSVYAADDGTDYGSTVAAEVRAAAKSAGLTVATSPSSAGALFYGASAGDPNGQATDHGPSAAAAVDKLVAGGAPRAPVFVASGLDEPSFVSALGPAVQKRLYVSSPGFRRKDLPAAAKSFVTAFTQAYGHAPAAQAVFGYEAMSAVLAALKTAGADANRRSTVVSDFRSDKRTNSVLGVYSENGGDPSVAPFVFSQIKGGQLVATKYVSAG